MANSFSSVVDPTFYGMTLPHFRVLKDYAAQRGYIIGVRSGKMAAVRWIEAGFPAKPMALKCKIDREIGLLVARDDRDRAEAYRAGYPILDTLQGKSRGLVAILDGTVQMSGRGFDRADWARKDIVVEPVSGHPITSDYDLAVVLDATEWDPYLQASHPTMYQGNCTNARITQVVNELNGLFGSERIVHGPQELYSATLVDSDDDMVLLFGLSEDVWCVRGDRVEDSVELLRQIIEERFPQAEFVH